MTSPLIIGPPETLSFFLSLSVLPLCSRCRQDTAAPESLFKCYCIKKKLTSLLRLKPLVCEASDFQQTENVPVIDVSERQPPTLIYSPALTSLLVEPRFQTQTRIPTPSLLHGLIWRCHLADIVQVGENAAVLSRGRCSRKGKSRGPL